MAAAGAKSNEPGTFGRNLRNLRTGKGWSQGELANKAGIGRVTITRLETGVETNPEARTVKALAEALGCDPSVLWASAPAPATRTARPEPVSDPQHRMTLDEFIEGARRDLSDTDIDDLRDVATWTEHPEGLPAENWFGLRDWLRKRRPTFGPGRKG